MAQIVIRNLDEDVKPGLAKRAAEHGWSMEEEARQILRNAVKNEASPPAALGSKIAARFTDIGLEGELPELHGQAIAPMDLDE